MVELKSLKIEKEELRRLPVFYSKIYYNHMIIPEDPNYRIRYSTAKDHYLDLSKPSRLISKIIDFSREAI